MERLVGASAQTKGAVEPLCLTGPSGCSESARHRVSVIDSRVTPRWTKTSVICCVPGVMGPVGGVPGRVRSVRKATWAYGSSKRTGWSWDAGCERTARRN
eukprot:1577131-Prymnesium_polylepis.1